MLSLGNSLSKKTGIVAPGVIKDNLLMEHKYSVESVQPLSDGAAYFNSSNAHIDLGSQANTGDDITFGAWVNFTDTGAHPIVYFGDFLVQFSDDTTFRIYPDAGTGGTSSAAIPSVLNNWTYITAVVDDDIAHHYYNGVLKETDTGLGTLSTDTNIYSSLGKAATSYMGGYMCNAAIWSRVLTQSEIKSIMWKQYADLSTTEKTSLVSFWNLDAQGLSGFDFVLDESQTLGANLWDGGDVGPDSLGDADGHPSHSMDISDAGLVDGDVIKITGTITGTDTGRVIFPDTGAGSNGIRVIPNNVYGGTDGVNANYWDTDGTKTIYCWVDPTTNGSGVSGNLKCRTSYNYNGGDDRTQKITNISVQKVTNAGRLV